jgi:hypothetical protein
VAVKNGKRPTNGASWHHHGGAQKVKVASKEKGLFGQCFVNLLGLDA